MQVEKLTLPTSPNTESLRLLLRARLMLTHALEHASQNSEFDNMIAILGLDNTIEYILRSVSTHLDLESVTGKSFDIFDLASLASSINKALLELANVKLPYMAEIKLLRQTRNLVQHGAVAPHADLDRFSRITERFFDKVLKEIFGFSIRELRASSTIEDSLVKKYFEMAEKCIEEKKWLESIVATRNAFENDYFNRVKGLNLSIALYPALVHARQKNDISSYSWDVVKEELELSYLGINTAEYRRFKEYLAHIPHKYCAEDTWGQIVMQRPWKREDAVFCYSFAINTALRWLNREKERLYTPKLDKEYVFSETIGGISLAKKAEGGCFYYYDSDERVYLTYADKSIKRRFSKLSREKIYKYKTVQYVDGKKESVREEKIQILGMHSFLLVNEPERWGILIWYKSIS
jgi:hypothetical protein